MPAPTTTRMVISDPISVHDNILCRERDRCDRGFLKYCICTIFLFPVLSLSEIRACARPKRAQENYLPPIGAINLGCEAVTPVRMIASAPVLSSYSQITLSRFLSL